MSLLAVPPVDPSRGNERMLPNDMLAEQSALGGMLLSAEAVAEVTDIWTFARDVRSRDPNWKLVATESEQ